MINTRIKYEKIKKVLEKVGTKTAEGIIKASLQFIPASRIVLASSLSAEDQVLTAMLCSRTSTPRIFTLDTGRLFPETYETMEKTSSRFNLKYEVLCPDANELEEMIAMHGPNLFYRSVELRKQCCAVRKTHPLKRVISTAEAWICGLRKEQALTRSGLEPVEWDETNAVIKINPLFDWTENDIWKYVSTNDIPYNSKHDTGFRSIGCAPCTRAIGYSDDIRSGRWWWEEPHHKECGLHSNPMDYQI